MNIPLGHGTSIPLDTPMDIVLFCAVFWLPIVCIVYGSLILAKELLPRIGKRLPKICGMINKFIKHQK